MTQARFSPALTLLVCAVTEVAQGIYTFELRAQDNADLPPFTPGSHLEVQTPSGLVRKYSLCHSALETDRYVIAVKREPKSRGGSASMIEQVSVGSQLSVSLPINAFALSSKARQHLLIAGGIGITPLLAMARWLKETGESQFHLVYCSRDPANTAFLDELSSPEWRGLVTLHHDGGDPDQALDLWSLLENPKNQHVYCCGPQGLMESVRDMTGHWPGGTVHFESFGATNLEEKSNRPFTVHLQRSGKILNIPSDRSILDVLREQNIAIASSCESGTCGSCRTPLLAGEVDHRDMVLLPEERSHHMMVCVSRACSPDITLDL